MLVPMVLGLVLAGCSLVEGDTPTGLTDGKTSAFKLAMLLPNPVDDKSWSQAGYEGLRLVEKELGAEVAFTASVPDDVVEQEKIIRQYVEANFDFIVGHGGNFFTAFERVAEEYPRTKFALVTRHSGNNRNLGAIRFESAEMGYLAGVVVALKNKTNKIAYIGGVPYADLMEAAAGVERGARDTNPAIEVSVEWVDSWNDPAKANEIASAKLEAGADVLLSAADAGSVAVVNASKNAGAYAITWDSDQHELAPNTILTTVVQRMPVLVLEATVLVQQGRWEGKQ